MITIIVTNVVAVVVVITIIIITVVIVSIQEPFIVLSSVTTVSTAQFTHQTAPKENFNVITTSFSVEGTKSQCKVGSSRYSNGPFALDIVWIITRVTRRFKVSG